MSRRAPAVTLATRGSSLALAQTGRVADALRERRLEVTLREVETAGDELDEALIQELGTTGAFVRSLDEEVLAGGADLAVHSMKDMPTAEHEELVVVAVPERGSAADALVTPDGTTLAELPRGATVGTASLRRRAQLLAERPDLEVVPLRGNVDTRVEKLLAPHLQAEHERRLAAAGELDEGDGGGQTERVRGGATSHRDGDAESEADEPDESDGPFERSPQQWFDDLSELERTALGREVETTMDAIVLAEAGLERSGLADRVPHRTLDPSTVLPAPAQGALAIVGRDDELGERVRDILEHPRSRLECGVERAVLAGVGGGCVAPIGVHAVLRGDAVHVDARVLAADGTEEVRERRELPVETPIAAAEELAADLRERGAAELVAAAREAEIGGDGTGVADTVDAPRGNGP